MGLIKEFKDFINKGNVVDLAVGIVIGTAFGKIVSSLVADIIMPPVGLILGGYNFQDIKIFLKEAIIDSSGKVTQAAVTMNMGSFLQNVIDFIIIAFCIFLFVKAINKMRKAKEAEPASPPVLTKEEILLTEIRDILKNK
jgi:large conductance mechanosensitive channel